MNPNDMYAIAAQAQRTPNFGFDAPGLLCHRNLQYASILARFGASLIDGFVTMIGLVLIVLGLAIVDRLTTANPGQPATGASFLIMLVASIAFIWLYTVAQETSPAQATFGKRMMGIKVSNVEGGPIGVGQSTLRFIVKMIPGGNPLLGLVFFVLDLLCLAMNSEKNRTLHDLAAGTVVICA